MVAFTQKETAQILHQKHSDFQGTGFRFLIDPPTRKWHKEANTVPGISGMRVRHNGLNPDLDRKWTMEWLEFDSVIFGSTKARCRTRSDADAKNAPLVVMLGWHGAKARNVEKYAQVYEKMGFSSVSCTAPLHVTFGFETKQREYAQAIFGFVFEDDRLADGVNNGVVIHVFSNGGGFVLWRLQDMLSGSPRSAKSTIEPEWISRLRKGITVAALVFDSAPCYPHPEAGASAIIRGSQLPGPIRHLIAWVTVFLMGLAFKIFSGELPGPPYFRAMEELDLQCPEVYLYAKDDDLVDDLTPALINKKRERISQDSHGCFIEAHAFDNSNHVIMLRTHPEEYERIIRSVVDRSYHALRLRRQS